MSYDSTFDRYIGYFKYEVLAQYRAQPDKYDVHIDDFEGRLKLRTSFTNQLSDAQYEAERIDIRFGLRTLGSNQPAVAVFLPDLLEKSEPHVARWSPFEINTSDWLQYERDVRFASWVERSLKGSWNIDSGPVFRLLEEVALINSLTLEAVGRKLYDVEQPPVGFPLGENTWAYEDAHEDLYRILADGLDKQTIAALGDRIGRAVKVGDRNTLEALRILLPALASSPKYGTAIENVVAHRRPAAHKVRSAAKPIPAYETFAKDLEDCVTGLRELRIILEKELSMDAQRSRDRQEALKWLPTIDRRPEPNHSINEVQRILGKTVASVEGGSMKAIEGVHQSEAIIITFTDGAVMGIEISGNLGNIADELKGPIRPDDFRVDFRISWVPPR